MAVGTILFSRPRFINLGVAAGASLLGGLTIVGAVLLFLLYRYGAVLRAKSRFAVKELVPERPCEFFENPQNR
jgi:DHA1 family multidrug resistance protein-like MFS transporter